MFAVSLIVYFILGTCASADAFQSVTTVYPGTMCTIGDYGGLSSSRSGMGQVLDGGGGWSSLCPILRTQTSWEYLEIDIYADYSSGWSNCTLASTSEFNPEGNRTNEGVYEGSVDFDYNDPVVFIDQGTNSSTWWTPFTGTSSDEWRSYMLQCDSGAPIISYYVTEYTY
jgi:hypothetical protein